MVEWKKIEDLGSYFGGLTGKTKKDFEDGNAKFITYMNVFANPSLDESTVGLVHINEGEKQNRVQKGDILFTGSSETPDEAGMSCVVTDDLLEDYYMNSFCFGLRLNNPEQYNLHYLKHLFRSYSIRNEISKTASGVTRFNISKARFGKVLIPIPSIAEQSRIVGILDTFTASIENLKQQIAQRRKQYEHYRDQLLDLEGKEGVEMKTLGEVLISLKTGLNPRKNFVLNSPNSKNYYITVRELGLFEIKPSDKTDRVTDDALKLINNRSNLEEGDILFSGTGTIGRTALVKEKPTNWNIKEGVYTLKPYKDRIDSRYLIQLLHTNSVMNKIGALIVGDPIRSIPMKSMVTVSIPVPSLAEQQRIVSILDTFEASIANLEQQLAQRERQYEYYRNKLLTF